MTYSQYSPSPHIFYMPGEWRYPYHILRVGYIPLPLVKCANPSKFKLVKIEANGVDNFEYSTKI